ncbi:MAG: PASTA domain-containing protein [Candidatus Eremiobacteraeota bacterium]|nr:PASTA domain-containing protein [Candidatus Eremiobacteraeota bacterium]MBV8353905.1 PASTA domain-containing protein [Candidatus Eremiobacteraeota bacterium]
MISRTDLTPARVKARLQTAFRWFEDRDIVFAVSLAFAVGVAVWFGRAIVDFFTPSGATVYVPSLIGQGEDDAARFSQQLGLSAAVVSRSISDQFPKGVVMNQQPPAGTAVRQGRQISLIVSLGVNIFTMPDLRFQSLRNANLALSRLKLQMGKTTTVASEDAPTNFVLSQEPPPLSQVRQGTVVSFVLSKGPPSVVRVPDFANMDVDQAREQAERSKVHLGQIVWTPFGPIGPPRGAVVRQAPGPGVLADPFAPISLQVSAGPGEYGYLVRQVHAAALIPSNDTGAADRVRVQVRDATGTWNVYDAFAEPGQRLDFNLTVVGSAILETYLNNELLNQTVLGKEPPSLTTPAPALRR